ncbi:DnaJ domain-containing protein [Cohnella rhizosphaerae]|uniref:DnaJ domain-containing protein n=1 Tax=Cohnella rhizosphaerae TaxID=1457232 RepID=A0A9X4KRK2_9BACL|nr:DnaJ domain-containing protein [Cohnella rhizosphaerae]MDG0809595.1 DnaJ domain-containing protein [Cohnella rhizosphaerae]
MTIGNPYETLGVGKDATKQEIKKAYQKLAKKWHPDVNKAPEAESKFKEIAEAYDILSHDDKRQAYEEEQRYASMRREYAGRTGGSGGPGGAQDGGAWSWSGGAQGAAGLSEEELYEMLFGKGGIGGMGGFGGGEGFGGYSDTAGGTRGYGAYGGGASGFGAENAWGASGFDPFGASARTQHAKLNVSLEQAWQGAKVNVRVGTKDIALRVPERMADGTVIRLKGDGANGLQEGDELLIELSVEPNASYALGEDGDLRATVEAAPWQVVLGGEAIVRLPDGGQVKLRIPPDFPAGKQLRIPAKGLRRKDGGYGDILFDVALAVPPRPSEAERELYRQLAERSGFMAGIKPRSRS